MTIFILVSILLVAALAIALLMGVSPASQKVKVRRCIPELRLCS